MTNRTFEELNRRCRNLNRKKWIKRLFLFLFLFVLIVILYFGYINYRKNISKKIEDTINTEKIISKEKVIGVAVEKEENKTEIKNTSEVKTKISKTKEKNISKRTEMNKNTSYSYNTVFLKPTITIPAIKKEINKTVPKETKIEPNISVVEDQQQIRKKKVYIKVKSLEDEESLLKANRAEESFGSTMKLSNFYLKKSKFEKAIYWSKKANHYKPSSFKPWLVYAQSKIKQGKKGEAIKAIETFLSYFNSDEGEKYLQSIRNIK